MTPRTLLKLTSFLAVAIASAGCAARAPRDGTTATTANGGIVIRRSELTSGSLLEALRTRLPMMTVSTTGSRCPLITFRGVRTISAADTPSLYIDGTLTTDTCQLVQMTSSDVESVEVYTSGSGGRPGIPRNPAGVILVFRSR